MNFAFSLFCEISAGRRCRTWRLASRGSYEKPDIVGWSLPVETRSISRAAQQLRRLQKRVPLQPTTVILGQGEQLCGRGAIKIQCSKVMSALHANAPGRSSRPSCVRAPRPARRCFLTFGFATAGRLERTFSAVGDPAGDQARLGAVPAARLGTDRPPQAARPGVQDQAAIGDQGDVHATCFQESALSPQLQRQAIGGETGGPQREAMAPSKTQTMLFFRCLKSFTALPNGFPLTDIPSTKRSGIIKVLAAVARRR